MRFDGKEVNLIEYPLFDSAFNGVGISNQKTGVLLFAQNTQGDPGLSNMQLAGQIPSGGVYLLSGMQGVTYFRDLTGTEWATAYGSGANQVPAYTTTTSSPTRMLDCHSMMAYGAQVTFNIARVPLVVLPWYSIPAAGGVFGQTNIQGASVVSNGMPEFGATMKFVEPAVISSLQNFNAKLDWYEFSANSKAGNFTGYGQGSTSTQLSGLSPLAFINSADGVKFVGLKMRGFQSFDIQ